MLLATDIHYLTTGAVAAGITFTDWTQPTCNRMFTCRLDTVAPYQPGEFYKRELPCILALLDAMAEPLPGRIASKGISTSQFSAIVVDGYVTLGKDARPGLGQHLYEAIHQQIPIIGVAKNRFANTPESCELQRGQSTKPLYITAVGLPLDEAKQHIAQMHGPHRIPTLLKRVDQLCRGIDPT